MRIGNLNRSPDIEQNVYKLVSGGILGQHREAIMSSSTRSTGLGLVTAQVDFRRCTKMGIMVKLVTRSILIGLVSGSTYPDSIGDWSAVSTTSIPRCSSWFLSY